MPVDVLNAITIDRSIETVSAYAMNPDNAPEWYVNIKSIEWRTPKPLVLGSELDFVALFLGRRLAYTYRVDEMEPNARFVMRTAQGPFPMETTYEWTSLGPESTWMALRNRGKPSGFSRVMAPLMAGAMNRANKADLVNLKRILENR